MKGKTKVYVGIATILGLAFVYYIFSLAISNTQNCATMPATDMDIGGHESLTMHIHQDLSIRINGDTMIIPANIGLENSIMRPIHTHDGSGRIHVEGTCPRDFTLGEFFDVWGETFTSSCIFENCVDENHRLTMYVNGVETLQWRDLVLKDGDAIEIVYEETGNE